MSSGMLAAGTGARRSFHFPGDLAMPFAMSFMAIAIEVPIAIIIIRGADSHHRPGGASQQTCSFCKEIFFMIDPFKQYDKIALVLINAWRRRAVCSIW